MFKANDINLVYFFIPDLWSTCSSFCSSIPMPFSLLSFPHLEELNQPCNCISHLLLIYINSWNRFLRFLTFSVTLSFYDVLIYKYRNVCFLWKKILFCGRLAKPNITAVRLITLYEWQSVLSLLSQIRTKKTCVFPS